ncbi:alpha/beta fold hydrolase [Nocardioides panzhihuensis]|uniref:Pimeloyl-ACP methyl ester carboxylesterase n=1 Tax=Nocardioides panzhihuensis TaxID=860243 RepID=A0A7Z0DP04_9ACTN|nr:pimeloyl-ACP methyl ester carboxylesterase [Nocardioides panzhihuensis]
MSTLHVTTTDGLRLAVTDFGSPGDTRPTLVCVHGYPDNSSVWLPLVRILGGDLRIVTYDVRGHGSSQAPATREGYLVEQLNADLQAVIDTVSPAAPVHLLAHDWGSTQTWEAVAGNVPSERIASFTSISGPSLDQTGAWLRTPGRTVRGVLARLRQGAGSTYIGFFQAPLLPELAWRSGLLDRIVGGSALDRTRSDRINGLELYRANAIARMTRPRPRPVTVPVQVIAPIGDAYVSRALAAEAPKPYVADLTVHEIEGSHWVVADHPERVAPLVRDFVRARS